MKQSLLTFWVSTMTFLAATAADADPHARNLQKEEANRKVVMEFFNAENLESRMKNVADNYKQHNPNVADGKQGVRAFFAEMGKRYPNMHARVVRVAADGDLVWVHAHLTKSPEDPGLALVDIFRVENGKLVEHWDIMQPVPENAANGNSMF